MEASALLCRGIRWPASPGTPQLSLDDAQQASRDVKLARGTRIGFRVLPGRWCLGHQLVADKDHRTLVPCPRQTLITSGTQCDLCEAADQTRAMHDFHRSDRASPGLRDYLNQPHWLYIATFAHGVTKVGTAANPSKWRRLAEQGAIVARFVAWCPDGASVRRLEDALSSGLGITQQVRANSKVRGLLEGHASTEQLDRVNAEAATSARCLLAEHLGASGSTSRIVEERWHLPEPGVELLAGLNAKSLQPYPADLTTAEHGFTSISVLGQVIGVSIEGQSGLFVANAALLKGRKLELGPHVTKAPPVQSALF